MKSTGVIRKIDDLGRIVLPKELRDTLDLQTKDPMEIYVDGDKVVLKKYQPAMACHITGEVTDQNITVADGKLVLSPDGAKKLIEQIQNKL